jgi:hypothetical protein
MMQSDVTLEASLQQAKGWVTEALRAAQNQAAEDAASQTFFSALRDSDQSHSLEVEDLIDR